MGVLALKVGYLVVILVREVNKNVLVLLMLPWVDLAHLYLMASTFSQWEDSQTLRKDSTKVRILQL